MGDYSPEQVLIFLAVAAVLAVFAALLIRGRRAKKPASGQQARQTTIAHTATRAAAPATVFRPRKPDAEVTPPPARLAVPRSANLPSYAAVAAAQAPQAAPGPPTSEHATAVDYTGALAGTAPNASYAAIAIATLLGGAPDPRGPSAQPETSGSRSPSAANGGQAGSYAAIAAALAATPTPPPPASHARAVIADSGEAPDVPPGASDAAIAVATAARAR